MANAKNKAATGDDANAAPPSDGDGIEETTGTTVPAPEPKDEPGNEEDTSEALGRAHAAPEPVETGAYDGPTEGPMAMPPFIGMPCLYTANAARERGINSELVCLGLVTNVRDTGGVDLVIFPTGMGTKNVDNIHFGGEDIAGTWSGINPERQKA